MSKANKDKFINNPDVDIRKYLIFEATTTRLISKMEKLFMDEYKKDPFIGEAALTASVYAPISFLFIIFEAYDNIGKDPSKEFPEFAKVYTNYLKVWEKMAPEWGKIPFKQFRDKFEEEYQKSGHHTVEVED
jgi:hypothetical protein